jgi:uncharacterized protein (TIGR02588 family)
MSASPDGPGPSRAEWTIFAAAALLILGVAGVLIADWLSESPEPAAFAVVVERIDEIDGLHHVEASVRNTGGQAVAEATVSATLEIDADVTELDEVVAFLSPDEETSVTFIFEDDPDDGELRVRVSSYREP